MKPSRNILIVEVPHDSLYDESGVMCYTYDSWGRILNITYPDNEVVNYTYDLGGQLQSIANNSSYTYLDNVTYDKFGAKVSQEYGNGITTAYSYNNVTRRLMGITTTGNGTPLSQIQYAYDLVGNVTQVTSSCPWLPNHSFTESFSYDAFDLRDEQGTLQSLRVFNAVGQEVLRQNLEGSEQVVNIATLAKGVYFLKIGTDRDTVMRKIVVE